MTDEPVAVAAPALHRSILQSLSSLAIKVGAAGLTYLTYVLLSRLMGNDAYGEFALGLSLATMLAVLAGLGQQTAILRFWPEEQVAGQPAKASAALRAGQAITIGGGVALSVALFAAVMATGIVDGPTLQSVFYLMAAALLVVPMAHAEFASSALRAQGSVWTALVPRDIAWRLLLCALAYVVVVSGAALSGAIALLLAAASLAAVLVWQWLLARRRYRMEIATGEVGSYWKERGAASRWFLGAAVLDSITINIDTVIVGLFVTQAAAGLYFNAFRTAGLLTLFMFANALVIAPVLARHFHGGDMLRSQRLLTASAWGGFVFSVAVFGGFVLFGRDLLALFGESYADGYAILIILSAGLLFDAATGPLSATMMMTGHERSYVILLGATTIAGVIASVASVIFFGLIGAAAANAVTRAIARIVIGTWCTRKVGLDPTVLGVLMLRRDGAPERV